MQGPLLAKTKMVLTELNGIKEGKVYFYASLQITLLINYLTQVHWSMRRT